MITTFESLLDGLVQRRIEFILVGGLAVCLNGFVRLTEDVDILIKNSPENVERLIAFLKLFGEGSGSTLTPSDFTDEPGAIRISEDFILDVFVRMNGKTFVDLMPHTRGFRLNSENSVHYLTTQGLIETKRGSVRDKDQFDLIVLTRTPNEAPPNEFRLDSVRPDGSVGP